MDWRKGCGSEKNQKSQFDKIMKMSIRNLFLLPALIAGFGVVPFGRVVAQPYTFGPEVQSRPSASIT